ncbi:hypothetical protein LDL00_12230 [Staphylococcus epidermidis]|uniref:hypothetical protein n=1 Tax=Staphylococcus epidermidis TaxID=1282 RepID=UPI001E35DB48|nr:hypothetical protein [Staphylococcus epidermidis]MCD9074594.1 hypothetical protein [Staphylococcus epidermidis]
MGRIGKVYKTKELFEGDYINLVVKQNTTDSKLSDEELNQMIRTSKPLTTFIDIESQKILQVSNS